jgi:CheY-like chemotaxis protein
MRILLIDDDPIIRSIIGILLRSNHHDVTTANNGREALDQLAKMSALPELILLDLMMPVMDGWTFRQTQRSDPRIAGIPVVVISAAIDSAPQVQEMRAAQVLQKPIQPDVLLATVARYAAKVA